jgi:hypothetical protein
MEATKTHWKKLTNPDYIGAYSLMDGKESTNELTVQIDKVVRQLVTGADGKQEQCTVAHLKGQKPFILNATNQKIMTKLFGSPFIEDWAGRPMTLYVAKVKAFGDTVDALRVRDKPPVVSLPSLAPGHPRWDGAKQAIAGKTTTIEVIKKSFSLTPENEKLLTA